ncbi:MAG: twitching motility protein PilT [Rhodobacteraceae bacterium]|nr:twitching motility protein PilT [Paracoccaceae bacterium]
MLFGKRWAEGSGVELGAASAMPVGAMLLQLLALFGLACLVSRTAMTHDLYTAIIGILTAAAFVTSTGKFSGKSTYALVVDGGYIIAAGALMIVIRGIAGAM